MIWENKKNNQIFLQAWQWNPEERKVWINVEDEVLKLAENEMLTINEHKDGCAVLHLDSGDVKLEPKDYIIIKNNKLMTSKPGPLEKSYQPAEDSNLYEISWIVIKNNGYYEVFNNMLSVNDLITKFDTYFAIKQTLNKATGIMKREIV